MLHRLASIFALATAVVVTPAQAQEIDPGLWEMTNDFDIPGLQDQMAQIRAAMENVPPELRAQMEAQMAQAGVGMMGDGSLQVCITPEEAAAGVVEEGHTEDGCTHYDVKHDRKKVSGRLKCEGGETGTFEVLLHDRRHFESTTTLEMPQGTHRIQTTARWLGPDCN